MKEIWICVYDANTLKFGNLYTIDKVFNSEEKATEWLDNAFHHKGADLRFWIPRIIRMKVE